MRAKQKQSELKPIFVLLLGGRVARPQVGEFEMTIRDLPWGPLAEIDSLPLLMSCPYSEIGVTIRPMFAVSTFRSQRAQWSTLAISDARMALVNYLYTLPQEKLSPCAAFVRDETISVARNVWRSIAHRGDFFHRVNAPPANCLACAFPLTTSATRRSDRSRAQTCRKEA